MTLADIERIRDAFISSTQRAVRMGFDAIALPATHGYLLHSFVSPISNKRTDEYGGSPENRMRFSLEVVKACRAVIPRGIPFGARITGSDWMDGGLTPDDSVVFANELKAAGVDYLCVSSGGIGGDLRPTEKTAGFNVQFAEKIKREVGIPTRAVGLIVSPTAGGSDRCRRQSRYGRARAVPSSTIRIGVGTRRRRLALTWRGRRSIRAPRRRCGREPLFVVEPPGSGSVTPADVRR